MILLEVKNLKKYFPLRRGLLRRTIGWVKAVDDVTLNIVQGETLGLVGESGCGKTTTGRCILRLIEPTEGNIVFRSKRLGSGDEKIKEVDITKLPTNILTALRQDLQIIFQDPYSSLNPRMTVENIVGDPLKVHKIARGAEKKERVRKILKAVGFNPDHMSRYPHEFSGGQRQRIGIARALILEPQLIIADEPVSALDVSIQAQVLNLLKDLQHEFGLTYLFISHDLSVIKHVSDRVGVMYLGKLVEMAKSDELFLNTKHPYTEALMSAVPVPNPDQISKEILLEGDVPNPANPPSGCPFHPRCLYAEEKCKDNVPIYRDIGEQHLVACHFAESLHLQRIQDLATS
jgi:peptide/nickel transport system ATP-binding protein